ncbi:MAG TPA: carboxypeptidase-like regulatory domain-containing protein [Tepidisphaeraceae bacterium]|nr:carboxypeptidase-like regulatory domain-containing protein [Tepidisphaeraceae bacterium]
MILRTLAILLLTAPTLLAADKPAEKPAEKPEPNVIKGRVVDAAGQPVAGAVVNADHTLLYNANTQARTAKDGTYRIKVPNGAYRVTAKLTRDVGETRYAFDLHPETPDDVNGEEGAIRDFTWRLSGRRPAPSEGHYGALVVAYNDPGDFSVLWSDVELTLTPEGKLIDGSEGKPVVGKLVATGDGFAVRDVPVGTYRITARSAPKGQAATPLLVRVRNTGEFAASVTSPILAPHGGNLAIHKLEIEYKKP